MNEVMGACFPRYLAQVGLAKCLIGTLLAWLWATHAQAGLPIEFEVSPIPATIVVGEPFGLEIQVTNTSGGILDTVSIESGVFSLIGHAGFVSLSCDPEIVISEPGGGVQTGFSISWEITDFAPAETAECLIAFPETLFPGEETIGFTSRTLAGGSWVTHFHEGFTYTLLPGHSELPVDVDISLERATLTVGEPLVIDMHVTNTSSEVLDRVSVGIDPFRLTWFTGLSEQGCEVVIFFLDFEDGPPGFGFTWFIFDLEPGETVSCRVILPATLFSGTESVQYRVAVSPGFIIWVEGKLTYTLLPVHSEVPVELEASVARSPLIVGEPLVIDLRATNISGEPLAPFSVVSHQLFHVAGHEEFVADGCDAAAVPVPSNPPGFGLDWFVPELQPGETATCRVTFPDTPSPGTEAISFFAWVRGTAWEELAEIAYVVLAEPPPVPVPVNNPAWLLLMSLTVLWLARQRIRSLPRRCRARGCRV